MVEKRSPFLHIFAKPGLNQNLIQLAFGKSIAPLIFYAELTEISSKKFEASDIFIFDDSILREAEENKKLLLSLLERHPSIFLLSESSSLSFQNYPQTIILRKPFSPGELRGILQKRGFLFDVR